MPIALWLLFDVAHAALFTLLIGGPLALVLQDPRWLLAPPLLLAALAVQAIAVWLLQLPLPRLRPGKHAFPHMNWLVRFALQRIVHLGAPVYMQFATLRFLALRGLGARVPFDFFCSADAGILDSSLVSIGKRAMIGTEVTITAHFMLGAKILFAPVRIGNNTVIGGMCGVGPGCTIGDNCVIAPDTDLSLEVSVGDNTRIGPRCVVYPRVSIGRNVEIGAESVIEKGVTIPDGATIAPFSRVSA